MLLTLRNTFALMFLAACSSGAEAEPLHSCDPLASTAAVANEVEYDLARDDGTRIVIVAHSNVSDGYGERLFYGAPPTLSEYTMSNLAHGKDACGDLFFDFDLDGQPASASLWGVAEASTCATATASRLKLAAAEVPLQQTGTKAQGLTYMCR